MWEGNNQPRTSQQNPVLREITPGKGSRTGILNILCNVECSGGVLVILYKCNTGVRVLEPTVWPWGNESKHKGFRACNGPYPAPPGSGSITPALPCLAPAWEHTAAGIPPAPSIHEKPPHSQLQLKGMRQLRFCGQLRCAGDCSTILPLIPSPVPVSITGESWMLHRYSVGPLLLRKGLEGVNGGRRLGRSGFMSLFAELLQASGKHSVWKRSCQSKQ